MSSTVQIIQVTHESAANDRLNARLGCEVIEPKRWHHIRSDKFSLAFSSKPAPTSEKASPAVPMPDGADGSRFYGTALAAPEVPELSYA
jgi:hypothetical protein